MKILIVLISFTFSVLAFAGDSSILSFDECYSTYARSFGGVMTNEFANDVCAQEMSVGELNIYAEKIQKYSATFRGKISQERTENEIVWNEVSDETADAINECVGFLSIDLEYGLYYQDLAEEKCFGKYVDKEVTIPQKIKQLRQCYIKLSMVYVAGGYSHEHALAKCEELVHVKLELREGVFSQEEEDKYKLK